MSPQGCGGSSPLHGTIIQYLRRVSVLAYSFLKDYSADCDCFFQKTRILFFADIVRAVRDDYFFDSTSMGCSLFSVIDAHTR